MRVWPRRLTALFCAASPRRARRAPPLPGPHAASSERPGSVVMSSHQERRTKMKNDLTRTARAAVPGDYPTEAFADATDAVTRLSAIFEANTSFLRDASARYRRNEVFGARVRACYPFVRVRTAVNTHIDSRRSYGFVAGPGVFETTVT